MYDFLIGTDRFRCFSGLSEIPAGFPAILDEVSGAPLTGGPMPTKISRLRERAYQYQSGRCCYCNSPMWRKSPNRFAAEYGISMVQARRFQCTAEHLRARQESGPTSRKNIAAACRYCNQARHRRRVAASSSNFKAFVARRLRRRRWHPLWAFQHGIVRTSQFAGQ